MKYLFLILVLLSCAKLEYKTDIGFLNSAQANSPEFPIKINNKTCKDSNGQAGLCSFRLKSDKDLNIDLLKWPEERRINFTCTDNIDFNKTFHVPKKNDFSVSITPSDFSSALSFACIIKIYRGNDEQRIAYMAKFHITVIDSKYQEREEIYKLGESLVIGQHSMITVINGKSYKKKTTYKPKKKEQNTQVISVSEMGRINTYGL